MYVSQPYMMVLLQGLSSVQQFEMCECGRWWVWGLPCTLRSVLSTAWPRGVSDILTLLSVVRVPSLPGFRSSLPYIS